MKEQCVNCYYFHVDGNNLPNGRCWRYPPTLFVWPVPNKLGQVSMQELSQYPPVSPKQGCGEHRLSMGGLT